MKKANLLSMIFLFGLIMSACSGEENTGDEYLNEEAAPASSYSVHNVGMINSEGINIGVATLTESQEGVKIRLKAEGLPPGEKAIHIHETGKCMIPDFNSAGAHFNPFEKEHGFDNPKGHHAGDLPNIEIAEDGTVDVEIIAPDVTLKEGEKNSLLDQDGSAIVIHEKADDYQTDPAGDAGARIACGAMAKQ